MRLLINEDAFSFPWNPFPVNPLIMLPFPALFIVLPEPLALTMLPLLLMYPFPLYLLEE